MKKDRGNFLILPSIIIISLVTIYPIIYVLWLSLHKKMLIFNISNFIGLKNYLFILNDDRFFSALKNTCYFTIVSVSIELILGLSIAMLLNRSFKGKGLIRAVILVPWAIPTVVSARMWEWIYNYEFGILNHLLGFRVNWLGDPMLALHSAIIMDIWKTTPFAVLLIMAGLQVIPKELSLAARVDGAGHWYIFRHITLPLLKPVIFAVLLFRTMDAFRVFDAIYVLTGGGPANTTETLSVYAYKIIFQTLQFGYGSAISVVVFFCTGIISIFYIKMLTRGAR